MTYVEILAKLKEGSNRWGINFQPPAEVMAEFLAELPMKYVKADDDASEFELEKPLTPSQAYRLAQFNQDTPTEIEDDQTYFSLWWD